MYDLPVVMSRGHWCKGNHLPGCPNAMNIEADPASSLADHGATLQRVIDALYRVVLHTDQEARAELGMGSAGVEQSRGRVSEVSLRHEVVCLDDAVDVGSVDADSDTHDHMLGTLRDASVDTKEVRPFEGLEPEAIDRLARNAFLG